MIIHVFNVLVYSVYEHASVTPIFTWFAQLYKIWMHCIFNPTKQVWQFKGIVLILLDLMQGACYLIITNYKDTSSTHFYRGVFPCIDEAMINKFVTASTVLPHCRAIFLWCSLLPLRLILGASVYIFQGSPRRFTAHIGLLKRLKAISIVKYECYAEFI